ncbi:MAG: hypothetical protein ACYSUF_05440 [Planctomycetota bacterium]
MVVLVFMCCVMAGAGSLPAASSDDHLWFVVRTAPPRTRLELRHYARVADGPYYTRGMALAVNDPDDIEAMAAWGNQLWLVFAPRPGDTTRRETFAVQVQRNAAMEGWYHEPHDHLRAVTSIEGAGNLTGLVGTADGPSPAAAVAGSSVARRSHAPRPAAARLAARCRRRRRACPGPDRRAGPPRRFAHGPPPHRRGHLVDR